MELSYKQFTLEIKELKEDGSFEGYVAAFNNIDFGNDILDSKAFEEEVFGKYYPLLADHDTKKPIGKFQIEFDNYGVKFKNAKFNLMRDEKTGAFLVPNAAEKYANLKNGDISGFSMGYMTKSDDCEYKMIEGKRCRAIKKAQLMEGSVVTFPMNDKARLTTIKNMLQEVDLDDADKTEISQILNSEKQNKNFKEIISLKDIETVLKENGFSVKEAKTLISKVKEFSNQVQCDVESEKTIKLLRDATEQMKFNNFLTSLNSENIFNKQS